jgi:eukaryotic-like serine/threonine-protein kinase
MAGITKLGKYLIRRELGKGAMGIVYEGFDPVIERTVAIKTILPSQLSGGEMPDVMARFKREAQAAGRLNHPGVVAVYDYGEVVAEDDHTMVAAPALVAGQAADGPRVAFIAMEYVKGRELKEYFEANERFPLKEVERIMGEILDALDHAHSKGVTHRDMKPANLILLADGKVKVADFGIARIETSELTQAGTVMGTPSYMSPEQFMGQTVDGRSDLFSCGVILYQFLTGEKPFTGTTTTIMYKVLREEPLPPSTLNLGLPPAMDAVVNKAIAKNPADRFQTAREFAQALKAAVAGQHAPATHAAAASVDATVVNANQAPLGRAPAVAAPAVQPARRPAPVAEPMADRMGEPVAAKVPPVPNPYQPASWWVALPVCWCLALRLLMFCRAKVVAPMRRARPDHQALPPIRRPLRPKPLPPRSLPRRHRLLPHPRLPWSSRNHPPSPVP